jgi:hypothetical protein
MLNKEKNAKLFHVIETYWHPTFEDLPIYKPKNANVIMYICLEPYNAKITTNKD